MQDSRSLTSPLMHAAELQKKKRRKKSPVPFKGMSFRIARPPQASHNTLLDSHSSTTSITFPPPPPINIFQHLP